MSIRGRPPTAYMAPKPLGIQGGFELYFTSLNSTILNDACSPLPASTPNITNRVVIIRRGTCTFDVKFKNVANAGG